MVKLRCSQCGEEVAAAPTAGTAQILAEFKAFIMEDLTANEYAENPADYRRGCIQTAKYYLQYLERLIGTEGPDAP